MSNTRTSDADYEDLWFSTKTLDPVEDLVYRREDAFDLSGYDLESLQLELAQIAASHHFDNNTQYRQYAEVSDWSPERLQTPSDIDTIPLIPSTAFKHFDIKSVPEVEIVKRCTSSGTQGSLSIVNRDGRTLERFLASVQKCIDFAIPKSARDRNVYVLGPNTDEAADLWFSYVLSIVDLIYPTRFLVTNGELNKSEALQMMYEEQDEYPVLIGPPVLVLDLLETMNQHGPHVEWGELSGMVITAGGWKSNHDQEIPRDELTRLVVDSLHLIGTSSVRDCYNAVELNSVMFECTNHRKHIPAWVRVSAREPGSGTLVPDNHEGLLAFCDMTPTSYPGFILTDDVGILRPENSCACGHPSRTVEIIRRVSSTEGRGCAIKMDRAIVR